MRPETIRDWLIRHKNTALILSLVLILGGLEVWQIWAGHREEQNEFEFLTGTENERGRVPDNAHSGQDEMVIKVDIKGAVKRPGVYLAKEGDRIADVLEKAGGLQEGADSDRINFSKRVEDEMVIYVPRIGEEHPLIGGVSGDAGSGGSSGRINLNQASEEELQTLPGIGPARARAIIEYREQHGRFRQIEEIMEVSGIGEKTFEKIKERIRTD